MDENYGMTDEEEYRARGGYRYIPEMKWAHEGRVLRAKAALDAANEKDKPAARQEYDEAVADAAAKEARRHARPFEG